MDKVEQAKFVNSLVENVRLDIEAIIEQGRIPENWDGIELREYVAEMFGRCRMGMQDSRGRRKRDYENEVIIRNL